ncbi:MAG: type II toxin-antitoxin system PemK/MazF family toxin [Pseudomonadota bacterium]|jgi:mRNA interferase MazF
MNRGEVWWADLSAPTGSGPGMRRPVLVVQADAFNRSRIATVIVAVITSNLALAAAPGNVRLAKAASGLPKPSVVNVSQVLTIDRVLLKQRVAELPSEAMRIVDDGLRLALSV